MQQSKRRTRAAVTVVVATVVTAAVSATGASAQAATGRLTFTTTPLTFTVTVGPADHRVTCAVDGDLRVPSTATAANPAPSLLMTNGFGGDKNGTGPNGNGAYAARFAELGYVTLSYTGLGFGNSSGCNIYTDDPAFDGQAGSQLVSFLGGAPGIAKDANGAAVAIPGLVRADAVAHDGVHHDNDPRVGMIGGSYGGEIQFAVASVDPRVDALAPIYTWNDLNYSLNPNNTALTGGVQAATPGVAKYQWDSLFFGLGLADPVLHPVLQADPSACEHNRVEICQANAEQDTQGFPSPGSAAFYHSVSVASYLPKIKIPVLLSQGENDTLFDLQEAIANYRGLQAQGNTVRMVWQSWGHSGGTPVAGELDPGTLAAGSGTLDQTVQGRIFIDWFAHWLRDSPTDLGPGVRYFRDYAYAKPAAGAPAAVALAAASAAYAAAPDYPVGTSSPLFLSAGNALVPARSAVQAGNATLVRTTDVSSYSETSALGALAPQYDTPGTFGAWTSVPLTADTDVAGVPALDVRLASNPPPGLVGGSATQPTLIAKLYDLDPTGGKTLVRNLVSPMRIPDTSKPIHIELPGIVHRFVAGHRLQLVLATGDSAYVGSKFAYSITVTDDPAAPNTLSIPLAATTAEVALPARPAKAATGGGPTPVRAGGVAPKRKAPARRPPTATQPTRTLAFTGLQGALPVAAVLLLGAAATLRRRRQT